QRPGGLHSCAVEAGGGAVWCWGWGAAWRRDADANSSASPVQVAGIQDAVDVACGYQHTCAMDRYGAATCWGEAVQGQSQEDREMWDQFLACGLGLRQCIGPGRPVHDLPLGRCDSSSSSRLTRRPWSTASGPRRSARRGDAWRAVVLFAPWRGISR
ncbi:unnamed protein product, partial [Prorocentrum cordatum]